MVLLKNDAKLLPFKRGHTVAVIGRAADDAGALTGNYDGPLCPKGGASCWPSVCGGLAPFTASGSVAACHTNVSDVGGAVAAAKSAQQVVLLIDNAKDGGGEGQDRHTISLATDQQALCDAVLQVRPDAALVIVNGGIIAIDSLAQHGTIRWCSNPRIHFRPAALSCRRKPPRQAHPWYQLARPPLPPYPLALTLSES